MSKFDSSSLNGQYPSQRACTGFVYLLSTLFVLTLFLKYEASAAGQDKLKNEPADKPLQIPKLEETGLTSPIFATLSNDSASGNLQIVVMPDFFGGNVRMGLQTWDNKAIQKVLMLSDGQLGKISGLKKKLVNELRDARIKAMQDVEYLHEASDFRELELKKYQEAFAATMEVLTPEQKTRYQSLDRRSRLVQLGWDFVFKLMDKDPTMKISASNRLKLEAILEEKREHFQKLTDERFAKFLSGLEEVLDEKQVATITEMVGTGKYVVRPTIEELASQLNADDQERFDLEKDRLALLRRSKSLGLDGLIYLKSGSGGTQTGNLARDVIASAYEKLDLMGDSHRLFIDYSDRNGPYGRALEKRGDACLIAGEQFNRGEISEDEKNRLENDANLELDNYLWKEVMGDLIPGLKRQVEQHLIQLEIQAIGFPTALTKGHLAKHVQLTGAQRRQLDKYYEKTREAILKDTHAWTLELENEIRALLTPEQVKHLQQELSAFDNESIIYGTPMLMLIPRLIHFPQ